MADPEHPEDLAIERDRFVDVLSQSPGAEERRQPAPTVRAEPAARRPFEEWAASKAHEPWKIAAAKAMRSWAIGHEMTEGEFDEAVSDATTHVMR